MYGYNSLHPVSTPPMSTIISQHSLSHFPTNIVEITYLYYVSRTSQSICGVHHNFMVTHVTILQQVVFGGEAHGGGTRTDANFVVDGCQVRGDGTGAEFELLRDLGIAQALRHET